MSGVNSTKLSRRGLNFAFITYVYKDWKKKLNLLYWCQLEKTQQGRNKVYWQSIGKSVSVDWCLLACKSMHPLSNIVNWEITIIYDEDDDKGQITDSCLLGMSSLPWFFKNAFWSCSLIHILLLQSSYITPFSFFWCISYKIPSALSSGMQLRIKLSLFFITWRAYYLDFSEIIKVSFSVLTLDYLERAGKWYLGFICILSKSFWWSSRGYSRQETSVKRNISPDCYLSQETYP